MSSGKKRLLAYINARFGKNPLDRSDVHSCRERMSQIRILYDTLRETDEDHPGNHYEIDDVTWTDLEMDEVYLRINQTGSYIGEQVLYRILHSGKDPFFHENREMMNFLGQNEKARQELALRLYPIGKRQANYYLPEFIENAAVFRPGHSWIFHVLQAVLAVTVLLAVIFRTTPFYLALVSSALINFVVYLVMKLRFEILLSSLSGIGQVLETYEWAVHQKDIPLPVSEQMKKDAVKIRKIRSKIGFLVYTKKAGMSGDILGLLFDYLFGIALIDVGRVDGILRLIDENREAAWEAFTFVGKLDAAVSILSFRESLPGWCLPKLTDEAAGANDLDQVNDPDRVGDQNRNDEMNPIHSQGLYHPLLRDPVSNDFILYSRAVLTGANASGKSTFMKALAVNTILAQTIDTACCTSLSLPPVKVMTSMAIRDDVVSGESYYVREVRYLKRMLDEIEQGTTTLCVIDEILKGTNQAERLAASEAVLKYLTRFPGYCIIATHDMELVNKLQDLYQPYYFESHITENNVTFDYRIHPGRGGESNALALLRAFGFPEEIVRDACSFLLLN